MKWMEYAYQPVGHVLPRLPMDAPESWLKAVHEQGILRVLGTEPISRERPEKTLESAVGQYFRPNTPVSLEILQVAGLLLKRHRLNRQACARATRRNGGGLYFEWFLAQIDDSLADPLPDKEFPLHPNRWRKKRAGRGSRDAE